MSRRDDNWAAHRQELETAAEKAGIDVDVMIKIAGFESQFNPDAKPVSSNAARNTVTQYDGTMAISSAHGYGQFLNDTWHSMVNKYGEKYGIEGAADMTREQANAPGLRENTALQAGMLAEFTRENIERAERFGGQDVDANVYAMHNLGAGGAERFLTALADNPNARVNTLMSSQVISGNPALYGDGTITLQQAYENMGGQMDKYQAYADEATRGLPSGSISRGSVSAGGRDPMADGALSLNERGAPVEQLQQQLSGLGYTGRDGQALGTDGAFGPNTRFAVEQFQRDRGLDVDGVAGRDTLEALRAQAPQQAQDAPAAAVGAAAAVAGAATVAGTAAAAAQDQAAQAQAAQVAQQAQVQAQEAPQVQPAQAAETTRQAAAVDAPTAPAEGGVTLNRAYELTQQYDHVKYGFGDKRPEDGKVDCSGWVVRLANQSMEEVNQQAGRDVFQDSDRFSPGWDHAAGIMQKASERSGVMLEGRDVNASNLREGMIIGEDNGDKRWDRGRFEGIDHITMVVRDPTDGQLKISQSRGGEGVEMTPLQDYLDGKNRRGTELFATDPLHAGRDLIQENGAVRGAITPNRPAGAEVDVPREATQPLLREDSRGSGVRSLQESLNELGYTDRAGRALDADSQFGPRTEQAVRAFQQDKGLDVDGIVGPATHAALDKAREQARTEAAPAQGERSADAPSAATPALSGGAFLGSLFAAAKEGNMEQFRDAMSNFSDTTVGRAFDEARQSAEQSLTAQTTAAPEKAAAQAPER